MVVYILFHETNTGRGDGDSDGYIEGVYATEAAAEAAADAMLRELRDKGEAIWRDPDDPNYKDYDWEHDFRVEEHKVIGLSRHSRGLRRRDVLGAVRGRDEMMDDAKALTAAWNEAVYNARENWTVSPHEHIERLITAGDALIAALAAARPSGERSARVPCAAHQVEACVVCLTDEVARPSGEREAVDEYPGVVEVEPGVYWSSALGVLRDGKMVWRRS